MSNTKDTPKVVDSSIDVRESKQSRERAEADLKVPDPKPERAKAILDGDSKDDNSNE